MKRYRSTLLPALAAATMLIGASVLEPLARGGEVAPQESNHVQTVVVRDEIAAAVRACDLDRAKTLLSSVTVGPDSPTGSIGPGLILGLGAKSCERYSVSLEALLEASQDSGFEDWRLFAVARSALELGQYSVADTALDSLQNDHPGSPLLKEAVLAAAELLRERGDFLGVVELVRKSRDRMLAPDAAEALEAIAWNAGIELDEATVRRNAAVRLLVEHPLTASRLKVIEEFRAQDGSLEWPAFMTGSELTRRAERLREVGLLEPAWDTLTVVPEESRDLRWRLVSAEVLTASRRGEEALEALSTARADNPADESDLEWRRAFAALEVSRARPGRQLNALQRQMMRERAFEHLERVIQLDLAPERSKRALQVKFEDALASDRFDEALALLRRLKTMDPADMSGARLLWQHGWRQHQQRNYSGAIGYWTELSELYPASSYNRSGLYWSARSHEALGNPSRSRELLEHVVNVPFTDFYRRQALRQLGMKGNDAAAADPVSPIEPWPRDPSLSRAEHLNEWGLDAAALIELEAIDGAEPRAVQALRSTVLSAAGEWRQSIIEIKRAFSLLGSPHQGVAPSRARYLYYPLAFDQIIEQNAERNGLDRNLVLAMIRQESAFDASAHSSAGARGLMQVMPSTGKEIARRLGLSYSRDRLSDPSFSIRLGTTYYSQVRSMFLQDEVLALAGYNAGPYRIKRLWRQAGANAELDRFLETLRLEETKSYVKRVLLFADSYRRMYPGEGEPGPTAG